MAREADKEIEEILRESKTIAVVGLSPNEDRASHRVARYLQERGYRIIPVNPGHPEILGEKCYPSLSDVPGKVDVVDIFRSSDYIPPIVEEAIRKGAGVVWMQLGVHNEAAARRAEAAGLRVVADRCMMVEHKKLLG